MSDTPFAISVKGLTKSFGNHVVVDHFDLNVPRGSIYGFLGPNGSGKTTTIRMMCGLLTPDAGDGQCLGYDIAKDALKIKNKVGYMTQKFSLYEDLTIEENLNFFCSLYSMENAEKRVRVALEELGLYERRKQLAGQLSGGWKQRLALAACLIHEPKLLLLDEPTAGVDPQARRDFWDQIRVLSNQGVTILVSTHYMDEAVQCDYIAYIAYGKKLIAGVARDIPKELGLHTWRVRGDNLTDYEQQLSSESAILQVARFGDSLHVTGLQKDKLERFAKSQNKKSQYHWTQIESGLEEAFIYLMSGSHDNFGGA